MKTPLVMISLTCDVHYCVLLCYPDKKIMCLLLCFCCTSHNSCSEFLTFLLYPSSTLFLLENVSFCQVNYIQKVHVVTGSFSIISRPCFDFLFATVYKGLLYSPSRHIRRCHCAHEVLHAIDIQGILFP